MADDLGGKAMAVMRVGRGLHAVSLVGFQSGRQTHITVTIPCQRRNGGASVRRRIADVTFGILTAASDTSPT
jgi:hypothetical protein